ncbi:MAG: hypothetical protein MI739_09965 [Bacteroidales bacterium]|nr:hypothetical protein [Bacteroidales bacterium]
MPSLLFSQSYSKSNPVTVNQINPDNDYQIKYQVYLPNHFDVCGGVHLERCRAMKGAGNITGWGNELHGWGTQTFTVNAYPGAGMYLGASY